MNNAAKNTALIVATLNFLKQTFIVLFNPWLRTNAILSVSNARLNSTSNLNADRELRDKRELTEIPEHSSEDYNNFRTMPRIVEIAFEVILGVFDPTDFGKAVNFELSVVYLK